MSKKMFVLMSSDGDLFEIEETMALQSQIILRLVEDGSANNTVPLANVRSRILAMVIEYCKKHVDGGDEDLKKWDAQFVKIDRSNLFELILAANYLNIASLHALACRTVADMIAGKTPTQIREMFNIENDFAPEEEEEIRRENRWVFE